MSAILGVLVVYKRTVEEVETLTTLLNHAADWPEIGSLFKLVLYDNSPTPQTVSLDSPFKCEYVHDPENRGVSGAYNYALEAATTGGFDWILPLDQDTTLPKRFLRELSTILMQVSPDVAAIVPKVCYGDRFFSPSRVAFGGLRRSIDRSHTGIFDREVTAIGSGVLLRSVFFQHIGGFSTVFWLDGLDSWIFHTIHASGHKVYVADTWIQHDLSVLNYDAFMTEERYLNILKYESLFLSMYKSRIENWFYWFRLLRRSLILRITAENKRYSTMTLEHLVRLVVGRS